MKSKRNNTFQHTEVLDDNLTNTRRSFLQKVALVTGAFVVGVLQLDEVSGEEEISNNYCCHLRAPYDPDCITNSDCFSAFYWICPWTNANKVSYIIKCVECFDIPIPLKGTFQCYDELLNHSGNLACSVALHPSHSDYDNVKLDP